MSARQAALKALISVGKGEYSNLSIDEILEKSRLQPRDKALAANIFYGVLERSLLLDHILSQYLTRPLKKLDPTAAVILRMGIYQLCFMDKIPSSAAVDECVKLTRTNRCGHLSGLVNAVLRSFLRADMKYDLPDESNRLRYLSVRYSCPEWMISLWQREYGEEKCLQVLESLAGAPPIFIKLNTLRADENELRRCLEKDGVELCAVPEIPNAYILAAPGDVASLRAYKSGMFHVQDLSSHLCCTLLGAQPGETVYDVCAAPGGKSFTIAQLMKNIGSVVACDIHEHRVKLIAAGAQRLGLSCVRARVRDALRGSEPDGCADRVICDVPCSGLGVIRRKPDLKAKTPEDITGLPKLQASILAASSRLVKPGGRLIYSTCTLNPDENERVVAAFLENNPEFEPVDLECAPSARTRSDEPSSMLTVFPQANGGDGFFIAAMRRK